MIPDLLKDADDKMRKAVESARHEFTLIRTGRATPEILEHVKVDIYGTTMRLNEVAAISVPEPRQLLITPFDRNAIAPIEKGIQKSDVNITPNSDGTSIRLNIPPLNEERRRELIKQVHIKAEHGRVSVRTVRQDAMKHLQTLRKDKESPISENDEKRAQEQVQKMVEKHIAEIDALTKAKEIDMMEV